MKAYVLDKTAGVLRPLTGGPALPLSEVVGPQKPTSATTGVPVGPSLTVHDGDLTITTPGQVVEGLDIRGRLKSRAVNVTVRRCIIRGPAAGMQSAGPLVAAYPSDQSGFLMEDCEVYAQTPTVYTNGIQGADMTIRRVNVHDVTDGMVIAGGTSTVVEASYIHGLLHWDSDPAQGGGPSHDDGIQIEGGSGIAVRYNAIQANTAGNAGVMVTQNAALINGLTLQGNWLGGGNITLITSEKSRGPYTGFKVLDNIFTHDSRSGVDGSITATTKAVAVISGNVRADTGEQVVFIDAGS